MDYLKVTSMKQKMKGGSEVIFLLVIPILLLIWFSLDESQKDDRYLEWLSKERMNDVDSAPLLDNFRDKPKQNVLPSGVLEGKMNVGGRRLDATIEFLSDGFFKVSTEEIGGVKPALFGKARFDGQVLSLMEPRGYLGLIPRDGIAISFSGNSSATIHQDDGKKVFMTSAARLTEMKKIKENKENTWSETDPFIKFGLGLLMVAVIITIILRSAFFPIK